MKFRAIKGTRDILPEESTRWQRLEKIIGDITAAYGYREIRTPIFEDTGLFSRSVGADTDIVSKEMYSWKDRASGHLTLRPELTAPIVRAYIQNNLSAQTPLQKLYYIGPLFRRERPQKGRYRQFHQFGVEAFGSVYPEQDAEIIALAHHIFSKLGIVDSTLQLNCIGSGNCRQQYSAALRDYLQPFTNELSKTSQQRLKTNPLRILDTKLEHEQVLLDAAPSIREYWTAEDYRHFDTLQSLLTAMTIPFTVNVKLVRGLHYYSRTTFEFISGSLGAQDAICGGGRYDNLVEMLGGKSTPAIGFAAGIERVLMCMNQPESKLDGIRIAMINLTEATLELSLQVTHDLRQAGLSVQMDTLRRSLKAQLRYANRSGATHAVIIGETEQEKMTAQVRDLNEGNQQAIGFSELVKYFTI